MKSRLTQIQKGTIEYRAPELSFSPDSLKGMLLPNRKMTVDISVSSGNGVPASLFLFSKDVRVRVPQSLSFGRSGRFSTEISTVGLSSGDRVSGEIVIVYNGGEVKIPYELTVGMVRKDRKEYVFGDLSELQKAAGENYGDAVSVFFWKEFRSFPFMRDMHLRGLYYAASRGTDHDRAFSEFMSAAGFPVACPEKQDISDMSGRERSEQKRNSGKSLRLKREYSLLSFFLAYERYLFHGRKGENRDFEREAAGLLESYHLDPLTRLLGAWYYVNEGRLSRAKDVLLAVQDRIQKEKLEHKDLYCLFIYLASLAQKDQERMELSRKLVHKYHLEGVCTPLMSLLEYRLNPDYAKDERLASGYIRQCADRGMSGTVLYQELCLLFNRTRYRPGVLTETELNAMFYGLKHGLISERLLFELLGGELRNPGLLSLFMLCLKSGYLLFKNAELLQAVCTVELRNGSTGPGCFFWFEEAVARGLRLSGLYEACLASVPASFEGPLYREMVLYFGYGKENSAVTREILYRNVLAFYRDDPDIFELYRERIELYALKKIRDENYSAALIPAYEMVLREDRINALSAPGMLVLFWLRRLRLSLRGMVRVLVYYPQLNKEAGYPVEKNEALVPVYSEEAVISFEDASGRRYFDPELMSETVFADEELRKQCMLYVGDSLPLKLSRADEIVRRKRADEQDLFLLISLIQEKKIDDFYRSVLYEILIDLSLDPSMRHVDCCAFLMEADFESFTVEYRRKFVTALIGRKYYEEAFDRIAGFGFEGIRDEVLEDLFENVLESRGGQSDPMLLSLCWQLFQDDRASVPCLRYLADWFSGSAADLTALSKALRKKKLPMTGLLERTFITSVYSGNDRELDPLFEWYMKEPKQDRVICDAFLILRSHQYFTEKRKLTETAVSELKKAVLKLPSAATLALLTWFSEKGRLSEEETALAGELLAKAAGGGIVLACFSKLQNRVAMPVELEGRVFVEYRSKDAAEVTVSGNIMPERRPFHRVLPEVYPGVYARSFVLYKREWIDYNFSVLRKDGSVSVCEGGILAQEADAGHGGSRYADISALEQIILKGDLKDSAELMRSLALKDVMIGDVFKDNE